MLRGRTVDPESGDGLVKGLEELTEPSLSRPVSSHGHKALSAVPGPGN